jgi:hypothetical protein
MELVKLASLSSVKLIVAPRWKYEFVKVFKESMEKSRNPGDILKAVLAVPSFKAHGQDIAKLVPALLKDASKLPEVLLDHDDELARMQESKEYLEQLFACTITIEEAEHSNELKAKTAMPRKPGIVLQ